MQFVRVVACVCLVAGVAYAETPPTWNRAYQREARGGDSVCPEFKGDLVVKGDRFTVPWELSFKQSSLFLGRISGTVRESGMVVDVQASLVSPLPSEVKDDADLIARIARELKFSFTQRKTQLEVSFSAINCYARWVADYTPPSKAEPDGGGNEYRRPVTVETLPPPKPLPGAGDPRWNGAYRLRHHYSSDWRCPLSTPLEKLVVANGKLSFPWLLETSGAPIQVAQLDGLINADGSVKLRTSMSVKELPPEITARLSKDESTIAYLTRATPTIKLSVDAGKLARGRSISITTGKNCGTELIASDYTIKDDGKVSCDSTGDWAADKAYSDQDSVVYGGRTTRTRWRCTKKSCTTVPGKGEEWRKVGICY